MVAGGQYGVKEGCFVVYFCYDKTDDANDPKEKMRRCQKQATDCWSHVGVGWEVISSSAQVEVVVGERGEGTSSTATGRKVERMGTSAGQL